MTFDREGGVRVATDDHEEPVINQDDAERVLNKELAESMAYIAKPAREAASALFEVANQYRSSLGEELAFELDQEGLTYIKKGGENAEAFQKEFEAKWGAESKEIHEGMKMVMRLIYEAIEKVNKGGATIEVDLGAAFRRMTSVRKGRAYQMVKDLLGLEPTHYRWVSKKTSPPQQVELYTTRFDRVVVEESKKTDYELSIIAMVSSISVWEITQEKIREAEEQYRASLPTGEAVKEEA